MWQASIVSKFQAKIERSENYNHNKLRTTLKWAREAGYFTMQDLNDKYNTSK